MTAVQRLRYALAGARLAAGKRAKTLDLWGNDLYLSHVYRTVKRLTYPTHVAVLGDMLGSQWISDDEFQHRGHRFWRRIFTDAQPVSAADLAAGSADGQAWQDKLIMLPGNHDVGYAGDMSRPKLQRYERMFGPCNYRLAFHPPANASFTIAEPPELRIAVLNSLTLDTPIWDKSLADESYAFVDALHRNRSAYPTQATVLLTHLPLHKPANVCVDGPQTVYFDKALGGGIRSQNFLSDTASDLLKRRVFGHPAGNEAGSSSRSRGVVLTGHDHEGCQSVHFWDDHGGDGDGDGDGGSRWRVARHAEWVASGREGRTEAVREITVRSMMGEFGGNAGLLSAWFDWDRHGTSAPRPLSRNSVWLTWIEWRFEYSFCALGVQHLWWTVHVVNVIAAVWATVLALWYLVYFAMPRSPVAVVVEPAKKTQ